jgi:hypothetical protein
MHIGNYESEAALVEPGVRRERAIRKGSNNDWGAPGSTGLVRACEQEPERERERRDERRGASAASRSGQALSRSPLFICEVHNNNSMRERGEQTYRAPQAQEAVSGAIDAVRRALP